jgi:ankyrin repeat protein
MAAKNGHTASLQVLVHAKADIDKARTDDGATPAFMAASDEHADSLQMLVHAKADIHKARTTDGATPAFMAARHRRIDSLRVLLQAAADVTRCLPGNGWSPLLVASAAGHLEVVRLLMDRAPQMVHVRTTAESCMGGQCIAAGSAPVDVARQLRRNEVVQFLSVEIASAGGQPKRLCK